MLGLAVQYPNQAQPENDPPIFNIDSLITFSPLVAHHHGLDVTQHEADVVEEPASQSGVNQVLNINHSAVVSHHSQDVAHHAVDVVDEPASHEGVHQVSKLNHSTVASHQDDRILQLGDVSQVLLCQSDPALISHCNQDDVHYVAGRAVKAVSTGRGQQGCKTTIDLSRDICSLNPEATSFTQRDRNLVQHGRLYPDLLEDWNHVQQVQSGGVGNIDVGNTDTWDMGMTNSGMSKLGGQSQLQLPFQMMEDIPAVLDLQG